MMALLLHVAVLGGYFAADWLGIHDPFGAPDAGGAAVPIQAVNSIPLPPHAGMKNPLATDTESEVPQELTKPVEREKKEVEEPDAIPIKAKKPKKTAPKASEINKFRPFKDIIPNQIYSKSAPALSSPMFSTPAAGGVVAAGTHTTLGTQCAAYAAQIQQLIASHWNTSTVDGRIQNAPTVDLTFELARDGTVGALSMLQKSGIPTLDTSVQRAVLDSNPLPRIPDICKRSSASVEILFELKR